MIDKTSYLQALPDIRWEVLRTIKIGSTLGATDAMCLTTARASFLWADEQCIREQLEYLAARKLIDLTRSELDPWRASMTRHGTDLIEYRIKCEPGINRPPLVK